MATKTPSGPQGSAKISQRDAYAKAMNGAMNNSKSFGVGVGGQKPFNPAKYERAKKKVFGLF